MSRANMLDKLSICGLRLEHMIATLSKKNQAFSIESINTVSQRTNFIRIIVLKFHLSLSELIKAFM
jgi:hypothetical protein